MTIDDYSNLRKVRKFRMQVKAPGFSAREIVGVDGGLYDVMLGYLDAERSVVFTDIGGQDAPGFDPEKGHGAILKLRADDTVEAIVPAANIGRFVPMNVTAAPPHFGPWAGHIFLPSQIAPGRPGANLPHAVIRIAPGADRAELVTVLPNAGTINDGIPGAAMSAGFAPEGSPFGQALFVWAMKNCTVYRLTPDDRAEVFLNFDTPDGPMMPAMVRFAPPWWGELAGELILLGAKNSSFNTGKPAAGAFQHFRVRPDRSLESIDAPAPLQAVQAPPEFGPFAGHLFFADEGAIDLSTEEGCDEYEGDVLPYSGRILRRDPTGQVHVFADNFWGSYTTLVFDGPRLVMGLCGKSYSTGEFHKPDAAIYEIRYQGKV